MNTSEITELLRRAADSCITPRFRALSSHQVSAKRHPNDLVTVADQEAERFISEELSKAFPKALVVGEEAVFAKPELLDELAQAEHAFVIDPVDGTGNFVRGGIEHGVMLAEVRDGETQRGWIWQPQTGRSYVAASGQGVWLNDEPLTRKDHSRPPLGASSWRQLQGLTGGGALSAVERTRSACAFDYPRVLHGELDFIIYTKVFPWDHLAGALMIKELGGVVHTLDGMPYTVASRYQGLIGACSREVYELVIDRLPISAATGV